MLFVGGDWDSGTFKLFWVRLVLCVAILDLNCINYLGIVVIWPIKFIEDGSELFWHQLYKQ